MEDLGNSSQAESQQGLVSLSSTYVQHLGKETSSKVAVEEACNALSWVYSSVGLLPITVDSFVKANLQSLQQTFAKPVVKKSLLLQRYCKL